MKDRIGGYFFLAMAVAAFTLLALTFLKGK